MVFRQRQGKLVVEKFVQFVQFVQFVLSDYQGYPLIAISRLSVGLGAGR